jgi:hypothetical protein
MPITDEQAARERYYRTWGKNSRESRREATAAPAAAPEPTPSLFDVPREPAARARRADPSTSHDAARVATDRARESQRDVYRLLRRFGPLTDEQLVEAAAQAGVQQSPSGLRTRRAELVDAGWVVDTGERRELPGRSRKTVAIVWRHVRPEERPEMRADTATRGVA